MAILKTTQTIMTELLFSISSAEHEILLQTFYIDNDEITAKFVDLLIHKSLQGVRVYCLVDALGGKDFGSTEIEERLKASGVHVEYFNWLTPWSGRNKKFWYFRNHKRALIIDHKLVHLGGWCIGDKTANWVEGHYISRDYDVIEDASADFWNMYKYAHKSQLSFSHQKKYVFSNKLVSYTYQAPLLKSRYIYYTIKKILQQTTEKVVLVTPYFGPNRSLLMELRKAKLRGAHVEIYIPKSTDHFLVDLVARTYILNLLEIGVDIYFSYKMIHAKVCQFDSTLYIGTLNLDAVSLRYNFENGIFTKEQECIEEFGKDIETLKTSCEKQMLEEWRNRGRWRKFLDKCLKLLRPFV